MPMYPYDISGRRIKRILSQMRWLRHHATPTLCHSLFAFLRDPALERFDLCRKLTEVPQEWLRRWPRGRP